MTKATVEIKQEEPRIPETKRTEEYLRYNFTDTEITDYAKLLARSNQEYSALEETKKRVTKELAASLEEKQGEVLKFSRLINNGHEYRMLLCTLTFDDPKRGEKTVRRDDSGEVVKVMRMSEEEMQIKLPLEVAAEEKESVQ